VKLVNQTRRRDTHLYDAQVWHVLTSDHRFMCHPHVPSAFTPQPQNVTTLLLASQWVVWSDNLPNADHTHWTCHAANHSAKSSKWRVWRHTGVYLTDSKLLTDYLWSITWYGYVAGNTVEENSSVFSLIRMH